MSILWGRQGFLYLPHYVCVETELHDFAHIYIAGRKVKLKGKSSDYKFYTAPVYDAICQWKEHDLGSFKVAPESYNLKNGISQVVKK